MPFADKLKIALLVWGIPIVIAAVVVLATPSPHRTIADFPSVEFLPRSIELVSKTDRKGSDHFELRLRHPDGREFFHRDPKREPVEKLRASIPDGVGLKLVYFPTAEGNVLMEVATGDSDGRKFLSFDSVMAEYASRRLFVYIVAGVWAAVGTWIFIALNRPLPAQPARTDENEK